jgi:predicted nucleic acid-binding protein
VKFWDSSALLPILIMEPTTRAVIDAVRDDPEIVVWWATRVECASALARLERSGVAVDEALERLEMLATAWHEVEATDRVRQGATRLLRVHPLRAADALQLAAAIVAAESEPRTLPFVTLDGRLADSASREGFPVLRPGPATP